MLVFRLKQWQQVTKHLQAMGQVEIHSIAYSEEEYQWEEACELTEKEFRTWCLVHSVDTNECQIVSDINLY